MAVSVPFSRRYRDEMRRHGNPAIVPESRRVGLLGIRRRRVQCCPASIFTPRRSCAM